MPRGKNILGQRFGKLVAIGSFKNEKNRTLWNMRCDCGNIRICKQNALSGGMVSCIDCSRHGSIAGKRFGRLLVIERRGSAQTGSLWLCKCDCGNEKEITKANLNAGKHVSCGCRRREILQSGINRGNFKEGAVWKTKEYYRDWKRNKRKNDPMFGLKARMTSNLRSSLKFIGVKKSKASFDILGYSPEELYRHIERSFAKGMTWENRSEWHIDHIIPLSTAKTEDDLISLNQLSNLRPMWAMENIKKANKVTTLL